MADAQSPDLVSEILTWYYGHFTAINASAELTPASDTLLSYRWFEALEKALHLAGNADASDLLTFLATGRPIDGGPVREARLTWDDPNRLSYWTAEEALQLWQMLERASSAERLTLDPDRAALPAVHEAVSAAVQLNTGVIISVG
ncbi:hypothetical protein [Deinococcus humi]|uniref:Uncharacterized protein n=1 Tax=Deinococcus humi TaxID=662880 RepID=A0A7W8JV21_9DEIO|nr:hypothetical protein [Deinococcus humi]MBB5363664.1 hypothetical protein [Deinococcus humi]GGO29858.1 hypothetical protein GCM10008949_23930 [Deinococcus humi]